MDIKNELDADDCKDYNKLYGEMLKWRSLYQDAQDEIEEAYDLAKQYWKMIEQLQAIIKAQNKYITRNI